MCLPPLLDSAKALAWDLEWTVVGFLTMEPFLYNFLIAALELACASSVVSLGSNQIFLWPQPKTEAASLFCKRRLALLKISWIRMLVNWMQRTKRYAEQIMSCYAKTWNLWLFILQRYLDSFDSLFFHSIEVNISSPLILKELETKQTALIVSCFSLKYPIVSIADLDGTLTWWSYYFFSCELKITKESLKD